MVFGGFGYVGCITEFCLVLLCGVGLVLVFGVALLVV